MDRVILHSDMNNCYAGIELLHRPKMRGKPLAVGGDREARHGIVLAKDQLAKKAGVKTGMAFWEARRVCPDLQIVPARMDLYLRFSRMAREIYGEYTDLQEPFGLDESWLDVTGRARLEGRGGVDIAHEIRERIKSELGITVSIGVSWNKIFAKLGSDYKKPDAVTEISRDNYRDIAWRLPAADLLCVGPSTARRLRAYCIRTIGDLAAADEDFLLSLLGKTGAVLRAYARGEDTSLVSREDFAAPVRSIGNSTTAPRDLTDEEDVSVIVYLLAESVAARLRDHGFVGRTVAISVRDCDLMSFERQTRLGTPTDITEEIAITAMRLFREHYHFGKPVRSIGVRISDLSPEDMPEQLDLFTDYGRRGRLRSMDRAVDEIRRRFGYFSVQRGLMYTDRTLSSLDARGEHTVHPRAYVRG